MANDLLLAHLEDLIEASRSDSSFNLAEELAALAVAFVQPAVEG